MERYESNRASKREQREDREAEQYALIFEAIHARKLREYFADGGGDPEYKPDWAEIDREVKQVMNQEYAKRQVGKALGDEL
jgi:hypothetical protein